MTSALTDTEAADDAWSRKAGMVVLFNTPGLARLQARFDETSLRLQVRLADAVLVAIGRKPNTDGLALDKAGVVTNKRGQIEVGHDFQTPVKGIYAIGDVTPGPMLAHKAEDEGVAVAEIIAGQRYAFIRSDAAALGGITLAVRAESLNRLRLAQLLDERTAAGRGTAFSQHVVDFLGRRCVRSGAAAGEEMRQPHHELLGPAGLGAEQAQRAALDHDDRVGATRHNAAGGQHCCVA